LTSFGTNRLSTRLDKVESSRGLGRRFVVVVTRGHLERAKKFLTRRGIDLETLIFVVTGVDRGLDAGAEEAGWLRMAQENRVV
jgi:hypothetical protein